MRLKQYVIFIAASIVFACNGYNKAEKDRISLEPDQALDKTLLSEIVDSVKYIRLENTDSSMLGSIREIVIKRKYIYVADKTHQSIFLFDKQGKFVAKLSKKGQGPDEYRLLGPFFVDEDEDFIEVIDYKGAKSRLLKYSIQNFDFLGVKPFNAPAANSWRKDGSIYYFSTQQQENLVDDKPTNADLVISRNGSDLETLFDKRIVSNGSSFSPNTESFTQNDRGEIYVSLMYNHNFYRLIDSKTESILEVDFGEKSIDNSIGLESVETQQKYLFEETDGKASFPVLNINNSRLMAFSYYFKKNQKNSLHQYFHFKKTGKVIHTKEIVNDLTDFPKSIHLSSYFFAVNYEVMQGDELFSIILPSYHLGNEKQVDIPNLGVIRPEDNPIILVMKVKNL
jgi:hypothetical protein